MKKLLLMFAIVFASICVVSCSSDDEDSGSAEQGITAKDLIGTWWISKSSSSSQIGLTQTYNGDGTWVCSSDIYGVYKNWELSEGKLIMTRKDGRKETYSALLKDGRLYLYFGDIKVKDGEVVNASESEVLERVDVAKIKAVATKDYFVGTWTRTFVRGTYKEYRKIVFLSNGDCTYSVNTDSGFGNSSYIGTWEYNPETREMKTTIYSNGWNWKIVYASKDEWAGDYGLIFQREK